MKRTPSILFGSEGDIAGQFRRLQKNEIVAHGFLIAAVIKPTLAAERLRWNLPSNGLFSKPVFSADTQAIRARVSCNTFQNRSNRISSARRSFRRRGSGFCEKRQGSVLLLVVVVIAMLTLAAYNFTQSMQTELGATSMYSMDVQAKLTADSGIEFAAAVVADRSNPANENLIHNPQLFLGRVVSASQHARANSRFSIIAPVEHDAMSGSIRYGLMDESAKLNLNALPFMGLSNADLNTLMMLIPNMTLEISDAILDWMDSDDDVNPYGAESETYQVMSPAYKAKNGSFESIDELLLVKGITPLLLYGEDANRNGLLDPNENDGAASLPIDNADGVLDHGFVAYLTVLARETNRRKDGSQKLNLNETDLKALYTALKTEFPNDENLTAQFIIGYRLNGASGNKPPVSTTNPQPTTQSSSTASTTSTTPPLSRVDQEVADGIVALQIPTNGQPAQPRTVMSDDNQLDLSAGGPNPIESLWQLFGTVTVRVNVGGTSKTIASPWSDLSSISTTYADLYDRLTVTKQEYIEGRININQARREVLLTIPTMTEQIADAIISAQQLDANGLPAVEKLEEHLTTSWLYTEKLVDLAGMQNIDPFITTRGDVYRVQSLGFFDGGGPVSRIEAVIDATQNPPRITAYRDLSELGRGYSRFQLWPYR